MPDKPSAGRRVMIYIPADLLARWDAVPRFERSALVAEALRRMWATGAPREPKSKKSDDNPAA